MKDIFYWSKIILKSNIIKLKYNYNWLTLSILFSFILFGFLCIVALTSIFQNSINLALNSYNETSPKEFQQTIQENENLNKIFSKLTVFFPIDKNHEDKKEKTKYTLLNEKINENDENYNHFLNDFKTSVEKDKDIQILVEDKSKLPDDFILYFEKNFGLLTEKNIEELEEYKNSKYIWFSLKEDTFYIKNSEKISVTNILKNMSLNEINTKYHLNNSNPNNEFLKEIIRFINYYSFKENNDLIEELKQSLKYQETLNKSYNIKNIIDYDSLNHQNILLPLTLFFAFFILTLNNSQVLNFDVYRSKHILEPYSAMNIPSWAIVLKQIFPLTIFTSFSCFFSILIISLINWEYNFTRILILSFLVLLTFNIFQLSINMVLNVLFRTLILRNFIKIIILGILYLPFRLILTYFVIFSEKSFFNTPSFYFIIPSVIFIILFVCCLVISDKLIGKYKIGLSAN